MLSRNKHRLPNALFKGLLGLFFFLSLLTLFVLLGFLVREALPFLSKYDIQQFIFGKTWRSSGTPPSYEIGAILLTTGMVAVLGIIWSLPLSLGVSLFAVFYAKDSLRPLLIDFISLLAGIPSIVFGFFGKVVLVKGVEKIFGLATGESVLAASILLGIMMLPFSTLVLVKYLTNIKTVYYQDSTALGLGKPYFIQKIALREIKEPLFIGTLLAFTRGIGETMAVMLVIGNSPTMPGLLTRAQTIPSLITLEMGMAVVGSDHYAALFSAGLVLLLLILLINGLVFYLQRKVDQSFET